MAPRGGFRSFLGGRQARSPAGRGDPGSVTRIPRCASPGTDLTRLHVGILKVSKQHPSMCLGGRPSWSLTLIPQGLAMWAVASRGASSSSGTRCLGGVGGAGIPVTEQTFHQNLVSPSRRPGLLLTRPAVCPVATYSSQGCPGAGWPNFPLLPGAQLCVLCVAGGSRGRRVVPLRGQGPLPQPVHCRTAQVGLGSWLFLLQTQR